MYALVVNEREIKKYKTHVIEGGTTKQSHTLQSGHASMWLPRYRSMT
jgi:hypothetical protein